MMLLLTSRQDTQKKSKVGRPCSRYVIYERCIGGSVGKYVGEKPLGRPERRWANNIKIGFKEIEWGVNWIDLDPNTDR